MKSIAVVCRSKAYEETRKKIGWFSYQVPDLEWDFYPVDDGEKVNKDFLAKVHDLIFWEDWSNPEWIGQSKIPIYAAIVDSNTSARRRKIYQERAKRADVLLIDQDKLSVFKETGKPVFRWQYAVNEHIFIPLQKDVDVAYHVERTPERSAIAEPLQKRCFEQNHSLTMGGGMTIAQYATRLGVARIVVHKSTHEQCRSHRFFDALAAGACLLTDKVWSVPEDRFIPGVHFAEWTDFTGLETAIDTLLETGKWAQIAEFGRNHVLQYHTWSTRAAELVKIIEGIDAKH